MTKAERELLDILQTLIAGLEGQFRNRKKAEIANIDELAKILDRLKKVKKDLPDMDAGLRENPGRDLKKVCGYHDPWRGKKARG